MQYTCSFFNAFGPQLVDSTDEEPVAMEVHCFQRVMAISTWWPSLLAAQQNGPENFSACCCPGSTWMSSGWLSGVGLHWPSKKAETTAWVSLLSLGRHGKGQEPHHSSGQLLPTHKHGHSICTTFSTSTWPDSHRTFL
jgi:hypothetical protein